MEYKGPEYIYWLFSSSAQSIAALVGLLTAGYYYLSGKLDDQVINDPTLSEIIQDFKNSLFSRTKWLCIVAGLSIVLSLLMIFANNFDFYLKDLFLYISGFIVLFTVAQSIYYIIFVINPHRNSIIAAKLIKENKQVFVEGENESIDSVKIGEFIEKFVQLEKIIIGFDEKYEFSKFYSERFNNNLPLADLLKLFHQKEIISNQTFEKFNKVRKIRNLAVHGKIDRVDRSIDDLLSYLIETIKEDFDRYNIRMAEDS